MNREQYLRLVQEIEHHDRLYYEEHAPTITDYAYDQLVKQVENIEKVHPAWMSSSSPTQRVSGRVSSGFRTVRHVYPMLSLANTYNAEELDEFIGRLEKLLERKNPILFGELKMDGVAISVIYEQGKLMKSVTRGDGKEGDDVTDNVCTIVNLPHRLLSPISVQLRGEVYMPLDVFRSLNVEKEELGEDVWANPRNAAAGSLKLLDTMETAKRKLHVVFYDIAEIKEHELSKQSEVGQCLRKLGLPTFHPTETAVCHSRLDIHHFAQRIEEKRSTYPFEIDGIVVKLDDIAARKYIGVTGKSPRWAVAYKFAPEQATTIIEAISVQVGRTGVLTPVAELAPVSLAGSTISRATLHNQDELDRKDIRVGDTVIIEKGGDVIPKVVSVDTTKRSRYVRRWKMPKHCPSCGSLVMHRSGEVAYRCVNGEKCSGQMLRRITFFVSKGAMDIDNIGEKVVEKLVQHGLVKTLADVYRLTSSQLADIEGFKEKSINNLLMSIEHSKKVDLARLIFALGIKFIGTGSAEILARHYRSIENLMKTTEEELFMLEGIGIKGAQSIIEYFADPTHVAEIRCLFELGVTPIPPKKIRVEHVFSGKVFVLTGTLQNYTRAEAASLIKERGGKVSSSVSAKTDYVLAGEEAGSKLKKAKSLEIEILEEQAFQQML